MKESMLPKLLDILELKELGENRFITGNLDIGSPQIYGGQVLAQSIAAAHRTTDNEKRNIHSLHGYFLSPGDNKRDVIYEVENIKDGRSFSTRRVLAKQGDRTIFLAALSFHIKEEGVQHQSSMPNVAQPESLTSFSELFSQFSEKFNIKARGIFSPKSPIVFHPVEHYDPFNPGIRPAINHVWFKANGKLPSEQWLHYSMLAYISDFNLLITALMPHNMSMFTTPMQIASLDHAMWFHSKPNLNNWHLYVVESPNAGGALAFCTGKIYTQEGKLIASVTQEGLIRRL